MPSSWLDKKFLENALGKEVADFEVKPIGGKNDNFTSNLFGVVVQLKSNEKEHLFVKKMLDTKGDGQSVRETSMFDREIHMYSVVLPKLSALLEKAIPGCEPIAPRYVFSSPGVLVLEDLSASGFRMLDRLKRLDLHHSLLVMQVLARFQAASVVLNQQEPECFEPYDHQIYVEPAMIQSLGPFLTMMTQLLADEIINWPGYGERYSKKIRDMSGRMIQLVAEAARRKEDRFNVLTHDDLWINNIMFRPPDGVRFIDFQMPYYSSIGNDLQLFINSSTTDDVRRNHINTMLKEYYKIFCDTLAALGYEGRTLTFEELQEEFRKSASYSLIVTLAFLPVNFVGSDTDIPMFESEKGLPANINLYNDNIKDLMIEMITYFEKQGAFDVDS